MGTRRTTEMLRRQWRIVLALHGTRRGLTPRAIMQKADVRRATLYRDLAFLGEAGVPISQEKVNGESRYALVGDALPALAPTALQSFALRLAREALEPLSGSSLVRELDSLLGASLARREAKPPVKIARRRPPASRNLIAVLERALSSDRRLRIAYRSRAETAFRTRSVDPLEVRLVAGDLYLVAWDHDRRAPRKFKVTRIGEAEVLSEKRAHPAVDVDTLFEHSVKVWTGEPVDVAIRFPPDLARLAEEHPLVPDQTYDVLPDDSVIVRARVSGMVEVTRWVLGWGAGAEVLEPLALRELVRSELSAALDRYAKGPARTEVVVSRIVGRRSQRMGPRVR